MTITAPAPVAAVRVTEGGLGADLRAVKVVLHRELIRFSQDRTRLVAALVQPLLFLFVLGTGLSSLTKGSTGGVDLKTFMFPGVLATSTLFTAMFSAVSIVWDREFGFLREMLVAPVRRGSIILGKALGGALVSTLQAILVIALAGLVHVPYDPLMIVELLGLLFLMSFMLTAFGLVIAARIQQMQAVMGIMQMLLLPLSFLSGALYPTRNLPGWMAAVVRVNPLTYGVHAIRSTVFAHLHASPQALESLNPALTWGSYQVTTTVSVLFVAAVSVVLLVVAIFQFSRTE
jgi:ABC-2 type transport system permease protein